MNKVIGYARISSSTGSQILDPQVSKLQESGCDQIFSETISTRKTEKERYTSYSLRIGGTTEMAKANIQLTKIYRYIGWSQNALPLIMDRYVRFTVEQLIEIPHDMIHNKKPTAEGFVFDPWDESNKR